MKTYETMNYSKKHFTNSIFGLLLLVFLMSGCSETSPEELSKSELPSSEMILPEMNSVNLNLARVAQSFSKLLMDGEVRSFLKTEALKQFDGDYDILYRNIKNHTFADGLDLESRLVESYSIVHEQTEKEALESIRLIESELPLLNISIPVNISKWQPKTESIPVTINAIERRTEVKEELKNLTEFRLIKMEKRMN